MLKAAGTTQKINSYSFFEKGTPDGTNYYRLKMTDKDGTFTLSRIVAIQNDQRSGFIIYLNPSEGKVVYLKDQSGKNRKLKQVDLINVAGITVLTFNQKLYSGLNINPLSPGSYTMVIIMENGASAVRKLIISNE